MTIAHFGVAHKPQSLVEANGIDINYDAFGNSADPAILLVMGLGTQMIAWNPEFCSELASRGFYVIRFDNRDIGLSTFFDGEPVPSLPQLLSKGFVGRKFEPAYTLDDMAKDAICLLDALGIDRAHIVGVSMGGMIAQTIAIRHRARVRTMTSIMSAMRGFGRPYPTPAAMRALLEPSPTEREPYIEHGLNTMKILAGDHFPHDEPMMRDYIGRVFDRSQNPAGAGRQLAAIVNATDRAPMLAKLQVPALVIHGNADPLVPVENGLKTAATIPNAQRLIVDGMGHSLPREAWDIIIHAIEMRTHGH